MSSLFSLSYKQLAVNNYIKKETDSFETASFIYINCSLIKSFTKLTTTSWNYKLTTSAY